MSGDNKIGMLEIIFGGLLISSLGLDSKSEREKMEEKAIDYDFKKSKSSYREEFSQQEKSSWKRDICLYDQEYGELEIKIANFESEKDWEKVIEYCNKYNKLILLRPWVTMDKRVEYEFKKLEAYINLYQYRGAWNSICKMRNMLLVNFSEVEYLNYLSRTESNMERICLYKNYPVDALYHNIMAIVYKDIFHYYKSDEELDFKLDNFPKKELAEEIENIIKAEYNNISEKTIRNINFRLVKTLKDNNFKFNLEEPKKYYPKIVARDFPIK